MHLEDRLSDVETDGRNRFHDLAPPNRGISAGTRIHGTHVPVEEPSTASEADIANCYTRTVVPGRNLTTALSAIRTKMANTTACVIANGGSDCVGANALSAETFTKLCTTRTKTFK